MRINQPQMLLNFPLVNAVRARSTFLLRLAESLTITGVALLASVMVFSVFVAIMKVNPLQALHAMYLGAFGTSFSWQVTLVKAAPLLLTGLCTALPMRTGLIVIGGEGAFVLGGLFAAESAHLVAGAPVPVVWLVMALTGCIVGGIWILIPAILRVYRGVNETISTLLMNYIAIAVFNQLVEGPFHDPNSLNNPSTYSIGDNNMIGDIGNTQVHWGLVVGIVICILAWILVHHTTTGFSADLAGGNPKAARLSGIKINRVILWFALLGGACAGLAGMLEVAAVQERANDGLNAGYGYAGILVAFMARQDPLAIIPVAVLLGGVQAGKILLQTQLGLPDSANLVFQGLLFLFILGSETLYGRFAIFQPRVRS